tara:strand:- start:1078 stop:1446 length:369 start_codon:yes stop_codon:yes gene_type:complete
MKDFKRVLLIVLIAIVTIFTFTSCEADPITNEYDYLDSRLVGTWVNDVDTTTMRLRRDGFYSLTYVDPQGVSLTVRTGEWFNSGDILFVQYVTINGQSDGFNQFYTVEGNTLTINETRWHKL